MFLDTNDHCLAGRVNSWRSEFGGGGESAQGKIILVREKPPLSHWPLLCLNNLSLGRLKWPNVPPGLGQAFAKDWQVCGLWWQKPGLNPIRVPQPIFSIVYVSMIHNNTV